MSFSWYGILAFFDIQWRSDRAAICDQGAIGMFAYTSPISRAEYEPRSFPQCGEEVWPHDAILQNSYSGVTVVRKRLIVKLGRSSPSSRCDRAISCVKCPVGSWNTAVTCSPSTTYGTCTVSAAET